MSKMGEMYQSADWKNEKHIPVIDAPGKVNKETPFNVAIAVGKEIAHPNTTEHHIRWIQLFFMPAGGKFPYQVGEFAFTAHAEAADGPNKGVVSTDHKVTCTLVIRESGTLIATSFCNIHGLWESSVEVMVE
jgi:superoxide reductase